MDFEQIRRLIITALFSDEKLAQQLYLKGGNALSLIYGVGHRASLDVDFSLDGDFEDPGDARDRMVRALTDRFDSAGLVLFDVRFETKPPQTENDVRPWWGGYELRFKVIGRAEFDRLRGNRERQRIQAVVTGFGQHRTFKVDFSKHEYTRGGVQIELDYYVISVYTLAMVAVEKLRAICQQDPAYALRGRRRPRARDFYDIHQILKREHFDLVGPESLTLVREIFAAKRVPLSLLRKVGDSREFHRPDWPAVRESVAGKIGEFDAYFDFVLRAIEGLHVLGDE